MRGPWAWVPILLIAAAGVVACGPVAATPLPTAAPATSYAEYHAAACLAWEALDLAVGNPDTGTGSALSRALDDAVAAGDAAAADKLATAMLAELERGRAHLAQAAGWEPARSGLEQLDRVFLAFEAMTEAERLAAATGGDGSAGQAAFEAAGGVDAWFAMFREMSRVPRPANPPPCALAWITP